MCHSDSQQFQLKTLTIDYIVAIFWLRTLRRVPKGEDRHAIAQGDHNNRSRCKVVDDDIGIILDRRATSPPATEYVVEYRARVRPAQHTADAGEDIHLHIMSAYIYG